MRIPHLSESGFTLIEVAVALVLVTLLFIALLATTSKGLELVRESQHETAALAWGQDVMERIIAAGAAAVPIGRHRADGYLGSPPLPAGFAQGLVIVTQRSKALLLKDVTVVLYRAGDAMPTLTLSTIIGPSPPPGSPP